MLRDIAAQNGSKALTLSIVGLSEGNVTATLLFTGSAGAARPLRAAVALLHGITGSPEHRV